MAYDYDEGEVSPREELAAARQKEIARFNRDSVNKQLEKQLASYDQANRQNAALRDTQLGQASRKSETDRFEAQRNLQNAALGLLGSLGPSAMNSSTTNNLMTLLERRNDSDNNTYWQQLQDNKDTINNAYQESYNQNQVAKNDAINSAAKAIRDIEGDLAANLSNINPNLYVQPGVGEGVLNAWSPGPFDYEVPDSLAQLSGYLTPDYAVPSIRNRRNAVNTNSGYFNQMMNRNNRRVM